MTKHYTNYGKNKILILFLCLGLILIFFIYLENYILRLFKNIFKIHKKRNSSNIKPNFF